MHVTSKEKKELGSVESNPKQALKHVSLWDVYKFSYLLACRSLTWRHRKQALRLLLEPCTYWRNVEVPAVINHLCVQAGDRILDIGSPKLASLFLWSRMGAEVYATDLLPYFVEAYSYFSDRLRRHSHRAEYHVEPQDARALEYPANYFDKVYAISVVEHIEDEGDSQAMREIARVLKVGGVCCLTVPFATQYREDRIEPTLYYKFNYLLRQNEAALGEPVFWQRHYDAEALRARLIAPSGLSVSATEYYGERWFPFEQFYQSLPLALRVLFSVPGPAFSKLLLYKLDRPTSSELKAALVVLRKAQAGFEIGRKR
jgi:SAM-dependent methyltransferase